MTETYTAGAEQLIVYSMKNFAGFCIIVGATIAALGPGPSPEMLTVLLVSGLAPVVWMVVHGECSNEQVQT